MCQAARSPAPTAWGYCTLGSGWAPEDLKFWVCLMFRKLRLNSRAWLGAAVLDRADLEHYKLYLIISDETFKVEICDLLIILSLFVLISLKILLIDIF